MQSHENKPNQEPLFARMFRQKMAPKPTAPSAVLESGNTFTKMFGRGSIPETRSIIETIVQRSEETRPRIKEVKPPLPPQMQWFRFSGAFMQFTAAFIVVTVIFFGLENFDQNNRVLGIFGVRNVASRLHAADETLAGRKQQESRLKTEIGTFQKGFDNRYEKIINRIAEARVNWLDIFRKINEVTDSVYEKNELSQYVQYTNFSFETEKGIVRVSGTLSDPLGKNLTKLIELESAFKNYPRSAADPDDKTEPYFYGIQEFKTVSKSLDRRTGRFVSNFQLSFSVKPVSQKSS